MLLLLCRKVCWPNPEQEQAILLPSQISACSNYWRMRGQWRRLYLRGKWTVSQRQVSMHVIIKLLFFSIQCKVIIVIYCWTFSILHDPCLAGLVRSFSNYVLFLSQAFSIVVKFLKIQYCIILKICLIFASMLPIHLLLWSAWFTWVSGDVTDAFALFIPCGKDLPWKLRSCDCIKIKSHLVDSIC